ncbi:MAG: MraY family glycosyltransferase [Paludibacter sp.]
MNYIFLLLTLFGAELAYFHIADHFNIIDKPNERSSHTRITLRGGGIVFYIGILLYFILEGFQYPWFFIGLSLITLVSFVDDIKPQSNKLRLLIHFAAMVLLFYQWGLFHLSWYHTIIAVVLNAYNFMDGINGITAGYSLVVTGILCYINLYQVSFVDKKFIYIFILALIVFGFFNFRTKARCFAGDVGAISAAFIIVFLLGLLIMKTGDYSYIILLVVYGVDTILTIIHRMILKENIFLAHRKHVYQIMANELKIPHLLVSLFYALLQLIIVIVFFVFKSNSYLYMGIVILLLSLSYVIMKKKYFKL